MTKTIGTYITTCNSLFFQSTLEQTIRQSLLFSDEVIIVDSDYTSDGTKEMLDELKSDYSQIKVYEFKEDYTVKHGLLANKKTFALRKCTTDFCILQDDDECIHEQYASFIKQLPIICPEALAFRFKTLHFYRSYSKHATGEGWYPGKVYMVKNIDEIIHGKVNNDLDNHIMNAKNSKGIVTDSLPLDSLTPPFIIDTPITVYHYGWCRNDAIMQLKKYYQEVRWHGENYWNDKKFPFKFMNPSNLSNFTGSHPRYMKNEVNKRNSKFIDIFTEL